MRDDLGFSQQVAQNTGDTVQIAAEIFTLGAAAKGIGAIGKVSKSAFKARFGENLSSAYSSKKVASASTSGASVSKNIDNIISEAERKGFLGIRGRNNSAGLELKNTLQLEGRTYLYSRNLAQNVDGRLYTGHAFDQMQNRGISLSVVRNAIEKGEEIEAKRNCWEYIDRTNCVSLITAKDTGNVITVKWRK